MTYIITFPNVTQAMKCEAHCKAAGIAGEIINLPAELKAGCGFAFRLEAESEASAKKSLEDGGVGFEAIFRGK